MIQNALKIISSNTNFNLGIYLWGPARSYFYPGEPDATNGRHYQFLPANYSHFVTGSKSSVHHSAAAQTHSFRASSPDRASLPSVNPSALPIEIIDLSIATTESGNSLESRSLSSIIFDWRPAFCSRRGSIAHDGSSNLRGEGKTIAGPLPGRTLAVAASFISSFLPVAYPAAVVHLTRMERLFWSVWRSDNLVSTRLARLAQQVAS